ncbi:MAG: hypothetical protein GXO85_03415 [Chlorobi bacterium]|nr:hypothetical protein [Chlorobiota bacterium]
MKKRFSFLFLLLFIFSTSYSQIKIKELPVDNSYQVDSVNFSNTLTRKIIPLNSDWKVFVEDSKTSSVNISVPSKFNSDKSIIYQRVLGIDTSWISNHFFKIHFLGISYLVDIYLNDLILVKKTAGDIPFTIELPNELINIEDENILTLKISDELDSRSTIPLHQRFLFPKESGGILREVFLEVIPKEHLELLNYSAEFNKKRTSAKINFNFSIDYIYKKRDRSKYRLGVVLVDPAGNIAYERNLFPDKKKKLASHNITLKNIELWSPENPNNYVAKFTLTKNDSVVDEIQKNLIFYDLQKNEDGLVLNGKKLTLQGVTYIISDENYGSLIGYKQLREDLQIIKNLGVNSVRFAKATPHPFALNICQELGLFAFVEMPLNSFPESFADDTNFKDRATEYFKDLYQAYFDHPIVLGIGLGGSYIADSAPQSRFITDLLNTVEKKNKLTYASFIGYPTKVVEGLDLYGVELYSPNMVRIQNKLENSVQSLGASKIFISGATYPSYKGNTNGYLNEFSIEGQAKFFEETINLSKSLKSAGFFINSMFDYYGDFNSLYTKFSTNNYYQIGILAADRNVNRIGYNVIQSKLKKANRITIPLGSKADDAPLFFIFMGLGLSIFMGVLVNSKKKFREDAIRALLRPYNFFADIRDHRIMSGIHSAILMVILAGAHALLLNNLFYYLRSNLLYDKLLIAFGNPSIIDFVSYFAWNPTEAFFLLFAISLLSFLVISILIKWASFFIRTKIYYRNIFFTIVWAYLPVVILLPLTMVLYRILEINMFNTYLYIFLFLFFIWTIQRLLKGVYVIFDVGPVRVYFYAILLFLILAGGTLAYYQFTYASIDYIINTFKQFQHL